MRKELIRSGSDIRGFALMDLLALTAVVLLVLPILVAGLYQRRSAGTAAVCRNHLRQVGGAIHMFADDNNGFLPPGSLGTALFIGQLPSYTTSSRGYLSYFISPYLGMPSPSVETQVVRELTCPGLETYIGGSGSSGTSVNFVAFTISTKPNADSLINYPFGYTGPIGGRPSRKLMEVQTYSKLFDAYALIDADRLAFPTAGWAPSIPSYPVHGQFRNMLLFDNRVEPRPIAPRGQP